MNDPVNLARSGQRAAADPRRQIALAAAAGSGKTKVLVDRYLNLCLVDPGADPLALLAVTFTRKAAVEIQGRLLGRARELAGLDREARARRLKAMTGSEASAAEIERAGWLADRLLEDPAGLGIGTIHAFCQNLLARFAGEAGLDPRLGIVDREEELQEEAVDRLEAALAERPEAARDYAALGSNPTEARRKVAGVLNRRLVLQRWLDRTAPVVGGPAAALAAPLRSRRTAALADLRAALFPGSVLVGLENPAPAALAPELAAALRVFAGAGLARIESTEEGSPTTGFVKWRRETEAAAHALADRLDQITSGSGDWLDTVRSLFLTQKGDVLKINGRRATKEARQAAFAAAAEPAIRLLLQARLCDHYDHTARLLRHGLVAADLYTALKRRDRVLDFQDLEYLALRLLTDPVTQPQVHFRLDARLDHVLLDEFQDTNRNQWELLRPLLDEILAGDETTRTVFLVGDVKQSIYGFRGAEPAIFTAAAQRLAAVDPDAARRLPTNFRSLPAVVDSVGRLFTQPPLSDWLGAEASGAPQLTARAENAGEVVLVEPFVGEDLTAGRRVAAAAVVDLVRSLTDPDTGCATWERDPETGAVVERPLRLGDVLVLCRSRGPLAIYERALREAGMPLVPAGRGLLARSREVQDVLALLRWLTYPADDSAGAAALRSPLFRLPESAVQDLLAARLPRPGGSRRRTLWDVVQASRNADSVPVAERVAAWGSRAGREPLHDLLRRIYREGDVLARFEVALGEQARSNLLRLLDLALGVEAQGGSPRDLAEVLEHAAIRGGEDEGALPGEAHEGRIRLLTVHGAKGLEAPVVVLVDAATAVRRDDSPLELAATGDDGPWLWDVRPEDIDGPERPDGSRIEAPLAEAGQTARKERLAEEAHVLYVAMTRARDRLYVLGALGATRPASSYLSWLELAAANARAAAPADRLPWRQVTAADFAAEVAATATGAVVPETDPAEPPRRAARARRRLVPWTPPVLAPRLEVINPSRQAGEDRTATAWSLDGDEWETSIGAAGGTDTPAIRRGKEIHVWLERATRCGALPPGRGETWREVRDVLANPELAWVFRPEAEGGRGWCEVPVLHRKPEAGRTETRVQGSIDRLVLRPGRADVIDYKSNQISSERVGDLTAHYRSQLLAYREAVAALYPDREVRAWLLFTHVRDRSGRGMLREAT